MMTAALFLFVLALATGVYVASALVLCQFEVMPVADFAGDLQSLSPAMSAARTLSWPEESAQR